MHDIAQAAADAADMPDFGDVLARGERRRDVRRGVSVGLAALAVAAIGGTVQMVGSDDGRSPEPAPSPSPTETVDAGPTSVPWWQSGVLHIGGASITTPLQDLRFASGTTVVGEAHFEEGSEWYLVDGDGLVPMVESDGLVRVTVAPDGEVVAWVESVSDDLRRVVLWDVVTQRTVDSVDVPVDVVCCDQGGELIVHGVDLDHRVVYSTDRPWLWAPGAADPIPITGTDGGFGFVSDPWPGGLMVQGEGSAGYKASRGVYGTVDDRGRFERVGTTPVDQGGLWSPDGESYVFVDGLSEGFFVQHGDEVSELALPSVGAWRLVAWESDAAFVAEIRGQSLARCDVVELACVELEQTPTLRTVWPESRS